MAARQPDAFETTAVHEVPGSREAPGATHELVHLLPVAALVVDERGVLVDANPAAESLLGYEPRELEALRLDSVLPDVAAAAVDHERRDATLPHALGTHRCRRRDGTDVLVDVGVGPLSRASRAPMLLTLTDVSRQAHAEREIVRLAADLRGRLVELGDALRAKDLLLREIHHRVKNNLQIVSSLLSLQARRVGDERARALFEESRERLVSMSLVHEQLYGGSDLGRVDFASYLRALVAGIERGHGGDERSIRISVVADDRSLGIDTAVPAGLLVHEVVTNALKHAFPSGGPGSVVVSFASLSDGRCELGVADDGVGAKAIDPSRSTFGTRLVALLVRQLDAELDVMADHGTTVRLRFRDSSNPEEAT